QASPKHPVNQAQVARPAPQQMRQAPQAAKEERFVELDEEALLQKELEEVGLDPDELDELGELY
ncbi:MAG: hypothetical protein ACKO3R_02070, partial [bacterium]